MLSVLSKAAIHITYSDPDGDYEGGRNGAHSAVKSGTYCAVKTTPPNKTFVLRVLKRPLGPAKQIRLNGIDHRAPFAQRKQQPWSTDAE